MPAVKIVDLGIEWATLAGAFVGLIVGLTGVGGGALMAPILLIGFGLELQTVVATDLLFATITKIFAGGVHIRNNLVDWQIVKRLWLGSIFATLAVVYFSVSGKIFNNSGWITTILGILILLSSTSILFGSQIQSSQTKRRIATPSSFKKFQSPLTVFSGGILGTLITMTSIGAGALGAVFLRTLYPLRMQPRPLIATDTIHAIPVSFLGGLSFLIMGYTDLKMLGFLLLGSIPMALVGSSLVKSAPIKLVKTLLSIVLFIAGIKLILL